MFGGVVSRKNTKAEAPPENGGASYIRVSFYSPSVSSFVVSFLMPGDVVITSSDSNSVRVSSGDV